MRIERHNTDVAVSALEITSPCALWVVGAGACVDTETATTCELALCSSAEKDCSGICAEACGMLSHIDACNHGALVERFFQGIVPSSQRVCAQRPQAARMVDGRLVEEHRCVSPRQPLGHTGANLPMINRTYVQSRP